MPEQEEHATIMEAIRRADAFANAVTVLLGAEEQRGVPQDYPELFWAEIHRYVIPVLEAEMRKAGEALERLEKTS